MIIIITIIRPYNDHCDGVVNLQDWHQLECEPHGPEQCVSCFLTNCTNCLFPQTCFGIAARLCSCSHYRHGSIKKKIIVIDIVIIFITEIMTINFKIIIII